ncbi:hypothetical protein IGK74_002491 [Enterococcus sp. AZ150]|uniref:Uncharacterized protein n=1 Tax=Enterococcus sulfureus ATCC 49903 TaxID=1140003 RepID=S0NN15_9ENTE|nr:hypothetical protein OMY_02257 [Enterococcus sulfureus ATCC 49903]EOT82644.1 hypothetical protein I573_02259 [Enterococcus sulfureus ATCC 49903]
MFDPVFILSCAIFLVVICMGAEYNPILKKYPIIQKIILFIIGAFILYSIIQIR